MSLIKNCNDNGPLPGIDSHALFVRLIKFRFGSLNGITRREQMRVIFYWNSNKIKSLLHRQIHLPLAKQKFEFRNLQLYKQPVFYRTLTCFIDC